MSKVIVTAGSCQFEWNSHWAQLPAHIRPGYTHGVAVDRNGFVHVFNQSDHAVLKFAPDGRFAGTWKEFPSARFHGAHGLTWVCEGNTEYLWLTDQTSGEVVKTTLDGETVLSLARPVSGVYADAQTKYSPTWVAQSPVDGTIFVADGYGAGLINRYDARGRYLNSWDGTTGLGRFRCPHAVWIGARPQATGRAEPVLYVTDRGHSRIQVFDLAGNYLKSFYQDHPCCFAQSLTGELVVADLYAFVNLYDERDQPVAPRLGDNHAAIVCHHGWPNVPADQILDGKFNSPHGATFDAAGNLYVVEWLATGRITKLTRLA